MKLTTLLLLLFTSALALAGIPPYEIHAIYPAEGSNSSSSFNSSRVINPSQASNSSAARLLTRGRPELLARGDDLTEKTPIPSGHSFCHKPDWVPNTKDYHAAISLLFDAPQFFVPSQSVRYALYGDAVVYICNPGGVNTGSLLEFMEAMADLDAECGPGKPGKRVLTAWDKYYGRTVRGGTICDLEGRHRNPYGGKTGLPSDLADKVKAGCKSHVNGFLSIFDGWKDRPECYDSAAREGRMRKLRARFPWYKRESDNDRDYDVPYMNVEGEEDRESDREIESQGQNNEGKNGQENEDEKGRD
ncbi:unnamed protein product [Clonostachys solani]|uniref:Uncharacterized protein n=1 Tax=Clonostachys solani TaxID=160281 RepID=A0A9P0EHS5_9HYPO|nr:unnamed protein product [Clonostachys solani]